MKKEQKNKTKKTEEKKAEEESEEADFLKEEEKYFPKILTNIILIVSCTAFKCIYDGFV